MNAPGRAVRWYRGPCQRIVFRSRHELLPYRQQRHEAARGQQGDGIADEPDAMGRLPEPRRSAACPCNGERRPSFRLADGRTQTRRAVPAEEPERPVRHYGAGQRERLTVLVRASELFDDQAAGIDAAEWCASAMAVQRREAECCGEFIGPVGDVARGVMVFHGSEDACRFHAEQGAIPGICCRNAGAERGPSRARRVSGLERVGVQLVPRQQLVEVGAVALGESGRLADVARGDLQDLGEVVAGEFVPRL